MPLCCQARVEEVQDSRQASHEHHWGACRHLSEQRLTRTAAVDAVISSFRSKVEDPRHWQNFHTGLAAIVCVITSKIFKTILPLAIRSGPQRRAGHWRLHKIFESFSVHRSVTPYSVADDSDLLPPCEAPAQALLLTIEINKCNELATGSDSSDNIRGDMGRRSIGMSKSSIKNEIDW